VQVILAALLSSSPEERIIRNRTQNRIVAVTRTREINVILTLSIADWREELSTIAPEM